MRFFSPFRIFRLAAERHLKVQQLQADLRKTQRERDEARHALHQMHEAAGKLLDKWRVAA